MFGWKIEIDKDNFDEQVKNKVHELFKEEFKAFITEQFITDCVKEVILDTSKELILEWLVKDSPGGTSYTRPEPIHPLYKYIDEKVAGEDFIDDVVKRIKAKQLK